MAKLERLIQLATLIRQRQVVSVEEMSRACKVSSRTIYRYLNTLARLGFLLEGEGRRDLGWTVLPETWRLNPVDLELLSLVLDNNHLVQFSSLDKRLRGLRASLEKLLGPLPTSRRSNPRGRSTGLGKTGKCIGDQALEAFLRARALSAPVRLRLKGRRTPGKVMWPKGIEVNGRSLKLLVTENGRRRIRAIESDTVAAVELVN